MSPEDTLDISGTIDQKLASWPAPTRDDAAWGARAEAILAAAQSAPRASDATISSLLEPPRLDPEPGEPGSTNISGPVRAAGEKLMSQESNPGGAPPKPEVGPLSAATPSKRPSLKELAARASQAGAARQSIPGASTPPPAASKPISEPPAAKPSIRPSAPSAPPRISDHEHDSGVIDLNKVNSAATPQQVAAAEKAQPAAHDLVGDDDKGEAAAPAKEAAKVASLADAREKKKEGGNGGLIAGVIALVAMAAGVAFFVHNNGQKANNTTAQSGKENPPAAMQAPVAVEQQKIAEAPKEEPKGLSIDSLPPAEAEAQKPAGAQPAGGGAAVDSQKLAAAQPAPTAAPAAPAGAGTAPAIGEKPGDLSSAMAKAVGDSGDKQVDTEGAVPANAGKGNQSVPEKPSQGSVNSAIGSVMGGAKSCVAGADDVSRAQITFGSNGSVQNVSVTGWAANNGQSGCVKSALKGASVGPFSQPTFTVGVTIRP